MSAVHTGRCLAAEAEEERLNLDTVGGVEGGNDTSTDNGCAKQSTVRSDWTN